MVSKRCKCLDQAKCLHPYQGEFEHNDTKHRKSMRTPNKESARRLFKKWRQDILEGKVEEPDAILLSAHITDYLEHSAKHNRTGATKDPKVLARFLASVGDIPLIEVSAFVINRWKLQRADTVAQSTVNREFNIVQACLRQAVMWDRLTLSPINQKKGKPTVTKYAVDDTRIRILTPEEMATLLTVPDTDSDVSLQCRATLGCLPRLSEVLMLQRNDIGPAWMEVRRKGGKRSRLPISQRLRAALLARCHKSGYIFGEGKTGEPASEQLASKRIIEWLQSLGIMDASHHTMRHTGVTRMLERGRNPRAIQYLAGWSSLKMLERYGHVTDAELRLAVDDNEVWLQEVPTLAPTRAKIEETKTAAKG